MGVSSKLGWGVGIDDALCPLFSLKRRLQPKMKRRKEPLMVKERMGG